MTFFGVDTSRRGQVLLPPTDAVWIYLVGTGGTGSYLAQALARLAWHARTKGIQVFLTFIDPDVVEEKNVGRQLFCPAEVGQYKAETLAMRFNTALGLAIRAVTRPIQDLSALALPDGISGYKGQILVLGAVDNHLARQGIAQIAHHQHLWWCDAGNEQVAGRVYIGNLTEEDMERATGLDAFGWCHSLPLPSVQDPDLLQPEPIAAPTLSCAELTAIDAQSLMINQMMASVMAQYATDFVLHRRLTSYSTAISLDPPTVISSLITEQAMEAMGF